MATCHLRSKMSCALGGLKTEFVLYLFVCLLYLLSSFDNVDGKGVILNPKCWIVNVLNFRFTALRT